MTRDGLFVSGWAGFPELFPRLSREMRFTAPFLDASPEAILERLATERGGLLLGWSTGAHLVLQRLEACLANFERIVLAAPFLAFSDSLPARIVQRMQTGFAADPAGTVAGFLANGGAPQDLAAPAFDAASLGPGLDYLLRSRARLPEGLDCAHVTVVHGDADRIVRRGAVEAVLAALPDARLVDVAAGHWIPEETMMRVCAGEKP